MTKQGHLRLKHQRKGTWAGAEVHDPPPPSRALPLLSLASLIISLLQYPIRLDKETGAALRLLGEVTRLRKGAWELLGVPLTHDTSSSFSSLEDCLTTATTILGGSSAAPAAPAAAAVTGRGGGGRGGGEKTPTPTPLKTTALAGAPQFFPQGLDPRKQQVVDEKLMVKGGWEGRPYCFFPGHDLWWALGQLRQELGHLMLDVPELSLLAKGELLRSEEEERVREEKKQKRRAYQAAYIASHASSSLPSPPLTPEPPAAAAPVDPASPLKSSALVEEAGPSTPLPTGEKEEEAAATAMVEEVVEEVVVDQSSRGRIRKRKVWD